jgi:hypothetical protein
MESSPHDHKRIERDFGRRAIRTVIFRQSMNHKPVAGEYPWKWPNLKPRNYLFLTISFEHCPDMETKSVITCLYQTRTPFLLDVQFQRSMLKQQSVPWWSEKIRQALFTKHPTPHCRTERTGRTTPWFDLLLNLTRTRNGTKEAVAIVMIVIMAAAVSLIILIFLLPFHGFNHFCVIVFIDSETLVRRHIL